MPSRVAGEKGGIHGPEALVEAGDAAGGGQDQPGLCGFLEVGEISDDVGTGEGIQGENVTSRARTGQAQAAVDLDLVEVC